MSTTSRPVPQPSLIRVQPEPRDAWTSPQSGGVRVSCLSVGNALEVRVAAVGAVSRVHLRWLRDLAPGSRVLGEIWEQGYGDLAWRSCSVAERMHPWSILLHNADGMWGAGVEVRAGAFAGWTVDPEGISLWLDLRAGADPVLLGDRELTAARVHWVSGDDRPYATQCALNALLCADPRPIRGPIVGIDNHHTETGGRFSIEDVMRDARQIGALVGDDPVRPYVVIGDGWSPDGTSAGRSTSGGPWHSGRADGFDDMAAVAENLAAEAVRPGIWFRPLASRVRPATGAALRPWGHGWALDASHPAVIEGVAEDVRRLRGWGFELIKQDYSTFDTLGRRGFQMGPRPAADEVHVYDRTRSTAEVLVELYRTIGEAAGEALVLGCNVVGHLAAGSQQIQQVGDHTSGRSWERTRRISVNALAFRLAQHRRFFAVYAGSVPSDPRVPWAEGRQFLDLIARSGTPLFLSLDPATWTPAVADDLRAALHLALGGGEPGGIEPLDWMESATPQAWRIGEGAVTYDWFPEAGSDPFAVDDDLYRPPPVTTP